MATVCAWSTFERLPAGVRDHYARANWIFRLPTLMVWRCAVASPSWTRSASISTLNPWPLLPSHPADGDQLAPLAAAQTAETAKLPATTNSPTSAAAVFCPISTRGDQSDRNLDFGGALATPPVPWGQFSLQSDAFIPDRDVPGWACDGAATPVAASGL